MAKVILYNTLSRRKEIFKPIKRKVGLYTCGPTVYNYAHLGNLRTYIFEDVLKRTLLLAGYKVKHIMNITDVGHLTSDADTGEDKMEAGAKREGKTVWQIADFYTQAFKDDLAEINILPPDKYVKAANTIQDQIKLVKKLEHNGFTYTIDDGLYFDTSKLKDYAELGRLNLSQQKAGARVGVNKQKRNPTDFALWKFSPKSSKRAMEWSSPWGKGFPGWHLECSAISLKYLGQRFDVHTGGVDHIPIHHTNERAQNIGALGHPAVSVWMHGEFLAMADKGKMAKSQGGFVTLPHIVKKGYAPLAFRYLALQTHYRQQSALSWQSLQAAQNALDKLQNFMAQLPRNKSKDKTAVNKFNRAIFDDLNTPQALAVLWDLVKNEEVDPAMKYGTLIYFDSVFGLKLDKIPRLKIPVQIIKLAQEREQARTKKDWAQADKIRKAMEDHGIEVRDTAPGTTYAKITKKRKR